MRRGGDQHATPPHGPDHQPNPEPRGPFLIGPHLERSRSGPPSTPLNLLDDARLKIRCDNEEERQARALTRRLVIAFVLIIVIGAVFFVVMPYYGMNLPPIMPILVFIAIAAGAILTAPHPPRLKKTCDHDEDGRPVGCCQGPRPLRVFRDAD